MRPSTGRKQTIPSTIVVLGVMVSLVNLELPDVISSIPIPCGRHVRALEEGSDPQRSPRARPSVCECMCLFLQVSRGQTEDDHKRAA